MPRKKHARRANGEGAIFYNPRRGFWEGALSLGRDPDTGKRLRQTVTGDSQDEVSGKLAQLRVAHMRNEAVRISRDPLASWLDRWYELFVQGHVKANTAAKIHGNIGRIKSGPLGPLVIAEVTQERVQGWVNGLAKIYAEATIRTTVSTLTLALDKLVDQKRVAANPARGVHVPLRAHRAEEARAMDPKTLQAFLEALRGHPYEVPILFMLNTGLRSGELCALDIQDYKDRIRISRTWSSAARAVQETTKTASSKRVIPRPAALDRRMTEYLFRLPRREPTAPLFQTTVHKRGRRLTPDYLDDLIEELGAAIDAPWISPHTLRHTYASTLFRKGVKAPVVSKLLGHKDVSTTLDIYIHMVPEDLDESTAAIGDELISMTKEAKA